MYWHTRMPERPQEGDMAIDVMTIQDPRSGLAFEVAMYPAIVKYVMRLCWLEAKTSSNRSIQHCLKDLTKGLNRPFTLVDYFGLI